jgi:hypothetical protein
MFVIAGTVYWLALLLFHLLAPRMEPAKLAAAPEASTTM